MITTQIQISDCACLQHINHHLLNHLLIIIDIVLYSFNYADSHPINNEIVGLALVVYPGRKR